MRSLPRTQAPIHHHRVLDPPTALRVASAAPIAPIFTVEVERGSDVGLCVEAEGGRVTVGSAPGNTLQLSDPGVARFHLELVARDHGVEVVDLDSPAGTRLGDLVLRRAVVPFGVTLTLGDSALRITARTADEAVTLGPLRAACPEMRRILGRVERLARARVSVLITGENGTGKALVARTLHDLGEHASAPFVTVGAQLDPRELQIELFGSEGPDGCAGAIERAAGGTLVIGQADGLAPEVQSLLASALERGLFRRVGGRRELPVEARVISTCERDLRALVSLGTFRSDLYYRLAVGVLSLPPLRDRGLDVALLVDHFLTEARAPTGLAHTIRATTLADFADYGWPGNLRELKNWVTLQVELGAPSSPQSQRAARTTTSKPMRYSEARDRALDAFEARYLDELMVLARGNVSLAAREAKMDRSYLIKLLRRRRAR